MDKPDCCSQTKVQDIKPVSRDQHRHQVRTAYAKVAQADNNQSSGNTVGCCDVSDDISINRLISTRLGYSTGERDSVPDGADLGLGCGNPGAIASLQPGETVVDLGSGAGFDCFLAAIEVGENGHIIGVDMTPDMLSKARSNIEQGNFSNVEFRLGEIEYLPIADAAADVIISNCVINLSPDKPQVFKEAFRILKAGGRLAISDVVATTAIPESMRNDSALIAECIGNASLVEDLKEMIAAAGFHEIAIKPRDESREFIKEWAPHHNVTDYVVSATIEAVKPKQTAACCS